MPDGSESAVQSVDDLVAKYGTRSIHIILMKACELLIDGPGSAQVARLLGELSADVESALMDHVSRKGK